MKWKEIGRHKENYLHPSSLPRPGCTGVNRGAPGCTPETLVSPRHTRPKFSSNPKPFNEIFQTPTPLQVVWFPPHTTFLTYHHPKLNHNQPSPPRGNFKYRITPTEFFWHPDKTHPDKVHPDKASPIKFSLWRVLRKKDRESELSWLDAFEGWPIICRLVPFPTTAHPSQLNQGLTGLLFRECWMCCMVVFTSNLNPQKSVVRFIVAQPADFLQTIMDWKLRVVVVFFGARDFLFHLMSTEDVN